MQTVTMVQRLRLIADRLGKLAGGQLNSLRQHGGWSQQPCPGLLLAFEHPMAFEHPTS
jgi:hypothetical protein